MEGCATGMGRQAGTSLASWCRAYTGRVAAPAAAGRLALLRVGGAGGIHGEWLALLRVGGAGGIHGEWLALLRVGGAGGVISDREVDLRQVW